MDGSMSSSVGSLRARKVHKSRTDHGISGPLVGSEKLCRASGARCFAHLKKKQLILRYWEGSSKRSQWWEQPGQAAARYLRPIHQTMTMTMLWPQHLNHDHVPWWIN